MPAGIASKGNKYLETAFQADLWLATTSKLQSLGSKPQPWLTYNQRRVLFKLLDVLLMDELTICVEGLGDAR